MSKMIKIICFLAFVSTSNLAYAVNIATNSDITFSFTEAVRLIDNTMTQLRKLVEELGCALFLVSHLKRPEGKGHEEGSQVSLSQLRGSSSLASLADAVIAFERDQQDEIQNNVMKVRVLKNRYSGDTGIACNLIYNKETGRLTEGTFDE